MNLTEVARIAHEVDRAYQIMTGDNSIGPWHELSAETRAAAAIAVKAVANFVTPEATHEAWTKELARLGWKCGEKVDIEAKTHPHLVPYEDLPFTMRMRDSLIMAVVRGALGIKEEDPEDESAKEVAPA